LTNFRGFRLLAAAVLAAAAAGCESPPLEGEAQLDDPAKAAGKPRVVVAVIDSGVNPYHSFWYASEPGLPSPVYPEGTSPASVTPDTLREFGIENDHILKLTRTGNPAEDYAADAEQWARVKPYEYYWFRGTNLIAMGRDTAGPLILGNSDSNVHGVSTTASVISANPEAIVVLIEADGSTESQDLDTGEAYDIAFADPAVDMVSFSYSQALPTPQVKALYDSFEAVVYGGKLFFSSASNDPWITPYNDTSGPWWSIGISGSGEGRSSGASGEVESSNGRQSKSGQLPDFVADFSHNLPTCRICQTETVRSFGTSFSTPWAAGVASRVLLEARRQLGHAGGIDKAGEAPVMVRGARRDITNWELRRALEQAAYVATTAEWDPRSAQTDGGTIPVNDEAPWLQVGWGELSVDPAKDVVPQALAFLGFGEPTRQKAAGFCDFQTKLIEARHTYWDHIGIIGNVVPNSPASNGENADPLASDPFIYCGSSLPAASP
jgi:hypothetical protein